jgi:hypothetical protein
MLINALDTVTKRKKAGHAVLTQLEQEVASAAKRGTKVVAMFDMNDVGVPHIVGPQDTQFVIPDRFYRHGDPRVCDAPWCLDTHDAELALRLSKLVKKNPDTLLLFDPYTHHLHGTPVGAVFHNSSGRHSEQFLRLETDRAFGKQAFADLGLDQPKYVVLQPSQASIRAVGNALSDLQSASGCSKVAIKMNEANFVGVYPVTQCAGLICDLLSEGAVVVEEYIGTPDCELNVCFLGVPDFAAPVLLLQETNRLLPNNTGGKTGLVMAKHMKYDPRFNLLPEDFDITALADAGCLPRGWFDISFMRASDGRWLATEWCCRHGVSNWCTTSRMFARPYADIWFDLRQGILTGIDLAYTHAASAELFVLNMPAGKKVDSLYTGHVYQEWRRSGRTGSLGAGLFVDPLFVLSSDWCGESKGWDLDPLDYDSYVTRMAVVSQVGTGASVSNLLQDSLPALTDDVPNVAYRNDFDTLNLLF